MKRHGRAPWHEPGELNDEQRPLYDTIARGTRARGPQAFPLTDDRGRLEGPFNVLLLNPGMGTAVQELGAAIRFRGTLPARSREIAILELAALRRSAFEWYSHERIARQAGLTEDEIGALRRDTEAPTLNAAETLVRRTVRTLALERDLGDAAFSAAEEMLGTAALMELVFLVGYYDMLALSLRVWRTPLPEGEEETLIT